ncbi:hypothetical protein [Chitinophaga sp. 212800010-3]|uniref:hypothetical protein n=1 Tax=unclassified Chitinophaga TaxID=2619133 RepID=UPI002DF39E34|nr:CRP-like cAMP-binding protein [Chitinophaga sp. 212800010-3]
MTKKNVLQSIFETLKNEMKLYEFKPNVKEQYFIRQEEQLIYLYQLLIYDRTIIKTGEKGFQIEPYVWINVKDIENSYREITQNTELKKETDFVTLGNSIANLNANPDGINRKRNQSLDLFIFEEKNIPYVSWELMKHFKETAFPYMLSNNTIARVDEILNKDPYEYCVHMSNDIYRFIKGLIAAKLSKSPKADKLFSIYSDLIIERDMPDNCKDEMQRLKEIWPMIGV